MKLLSLIKRDFRDAEKCKIMVNDLYQGLLQLSTRNLKNKCIHFLHSLNLDSDCLIHVGFHPLTSKGISAMKIVESLNNFLNLNISGGKNGITGAKRKWYVSVSTRTVYTPVVIVRLCKRSCTFCGNYWNSAVLFYGQLYCGRSMKSWYAV